MILEYHEGPEDRGQHPERKRMKPTRNKALLQDNCPVKWLRPCETREGENTLTFPEHSILRRAVTVTVSPFSTPFYRQSPGWTKACANLPTTIMGDGSLRA